MSNVPPPPPPPPPASVPPPPPPGFSYSSAAGPPRNGLGTASLVLGVLSLIGSVLLLPIVLGVIGLILGIMGRVRASRGEATNGGIAIAGIITSVLGIAAAIALIVFVFVATDIGSLVECLDDAGDNQAEIDRCEQEFQDDFLGG